MARPVRHGPIRWAGRAVSGRPSSPGGTGHRSVLPVMWMNTSSRFGSPTGVGETAAARGHGLGHRGHESGGLAVHQDPQTPPSGGRVVEALRLADPVEHADGTCQQRVAVGPGAGVDGAVEGALAGHVAHQRGRRVEGQQGAVVDDGHPVAQRGRLLHVVGGDHHRGARRPEFGHLLPEEQACRGVEARRRLVEEEHRRRVHEGPGDHHPLDLAAGEVVGPALGPVGQPELVEQGVGPPGPVGPGHAVVAGVEQQVLSDRQRPVEVVLLGHHAEHPAGADGVGHHVDARPQRPGPGGARCGRQVPMVVDLPAPFGAEEAEASPRPTRKLTPARESTAARG